LKVFQFDWQRKKLPSKILLSWSWFVLRLNLHSRKLERFLFVAFIHIRDHLCFKSFSDYLSSMIFIVEKLLIRVKHIFRKIQTKWEKVFFHQLKNLIIYTFQRKKPNVNLFISIIIFVNAKQIRDGEKFSQNKRG